MKKILLFSIGVILSGAVSAQNFTTEMDTVKSVVGGTTAEVHDNITNQTSAPIKIDWKVTSTNMTGAWIADGVVGICDNNQCYANQNNSLLDGSSTYTSNDYVPNVLGDFHMQLTSLNTVPAGTVYVTVNLTHGTQSQDMTFLLTKFPTGVTSVTKVLDDVAVYPNPAKDEVNVIFDPKSNVKSITMYNLIGKAVRVYRVSGNSAKLSISDMPQGVYFLRLQDAQGRVVATRKLAHQ